MFKFLNSQNKRLGLIQNNAIVNNRINYINQSQVFLYICNVIYQ